MRLGAIALLVLAVGGLGGCGLEHGAQLGGIVAARAGVLPSGAAVLVSRPIATGLVRDSAVAAEAGAVAWTTRGARPGVLLARVGSGPTRRLASGVAGSIDVGLASDGAPTVVWFGRCQDGSCPVFAADARGGPVRQLASVARSGYPALAYAGSTLVYSDRLGRCAVLVALDVGTGRKHTLDQAACPFSIADVDVDGDRVAAVSLQDVANNPEHFRSVVRVLPVDGGRGHPVQQVPTHEGDGSEIKAVSLDAGAVYTERSDEEGLGGRFTRVPLGGGHPTYANATAPLTGGYARDGGRQYYVTQLAGSCRPSCPPTELIAEGDPFSAERRAVPKVTVDHRGPRLIAGHVSCRRLGPVHTLGRAPFARARVQLRVGGSTIISRTAGDGRWTARPPGTDRRVDVHLAPGTPLSC